ncbi:hypothetical protein KZO83_07700 [Chromohalobacter sp. TMW 2.2308]|uniref:Uncharacterized protein n=1 Tax=Chromohalobacter moromii TaxID=2860329 RepID=A0A9X2X393_9GAMM|nr:hypothetical protein [Chromohalobacter moromii]MCK2042571.1 hypothetical protein [Chromohalobacter moromii]MCT8506132.1 hypothetical protein [Chromohalobacter moromii]
MAKTPLDPHGQPVTRQLSLPRKKLISILILMIVSSVSYAKDCNQEEAKDEWRNLEQKKVVGGVGFINKLPTVSVDESTWRQVSYGARVGLVELLDCIVMGPEESFTKIQVVNFGGRPLAVWDAISREFDFK